MVEFCLRHDKSPTGDKILWFIGLFHRCLFGSALYFFIVYESERAGLAWPV